ncbi:MAG: hypothetical protein E7191_07285 [Erysipelotrichaceae bacterium]|nr:hypothetical protein [Erysipelotrichaceae bacterium]
MPETNKTSSATKRTNTTNTETKKKVVKKVVRRKKKAKHSKLLWFALVVAAIPCILVVYILFSALVDTGKPIFGDRYTNDLDPAITEQQTNNIEYNIKLIENVENVSLNLISSTLRITIDMTDTLTVEDAKNIGMKAAEAIDEVLPYETYFTQYGTKKMYDFEITVIDQLPTDTTTPLIQVIVYKNGGMTAPGTQVLSESKNPEYVEQLEAEKAAQEANTEGN